MNKRKITGIILFLIGLGMPLVLYFFQEDGVVWTINIHKTIERKLTKDEINALNEVSRIKKELETLYPDEFKNIAPTITEEKPPAHKMSFEDFVRVMLYYESKLIQPVKRSYAVNNFEKEGWTIDSIERVEIPYRQIVGMGILFIFLGLSFFIFSFFHKRKKSPSP